MEYQKILSGITRNQQELVDALGRISPPCLIHEKLQTIVCMFWNKQVLQYSHDQQMRYHCGYVARPIIRSRDISSNLTTTAGNEMQVSIPVTIELSDHWLTNMSLACMIWIMTLSWLVWAQKYCPYLWIKNAVVSASWKYRLAVSNLSLKSQVHKL